MKTGAVSRRDFLVKGLQVIGAGAAASVWGQIWPARRGWPAEVPPNWEERWAHHAYLFVVDTRRCIGCGHCVVACKEENGVPLEAEAYRTWVEQYVVRPGGAVEVRSPHGGQEGFSAAAPQGEVEKAFFVPKLCNQCANPPCVKVCPVAATYQTGDGVVLVDRERCIGCGYCVQACPYGARFLYPKLRVADKCTWCYHRIVKGLLPACVQVCPTGARMFSDLGREPDSQVKKLVDEQATNVLKQDMGTEPQVFYLGLDRVVV